MEHIQRGVVIGCLLVAMLVNGHAFRIEGSGSLSGYDDLYTRPLGETGALRGAEEPLLKVTSPKISITATTSSDSAANGFGGGSGSGGSDASLLSTMVTEFLASTAQTPNKEDETEMAAAIEAAHMSSEQPVAAATTTTTTLVPSSTSTASSASFQPIGGDETGKRRVITYDQRQEGQYNVRADLENFMIVLIPPTSVSDSLLDLLRRQQQRQSTINALKRNKVKHHHGSGSGAVAAMQLEHGDSDGNGSGKYQHPSIKIGQSAAAATGNYLLQQQQRPHYGGAASGYPLMPPLNAMHTSFVEAANAGGMAGNAEAATDKLGAPAEFIEGRTPYRVDISASDDEQLHLHLPERQQQQQSLQHGHANAADQAQHVVDVLPPPYTPLAYQHLMKPYLEAEPTFPPSELKRSGSSHLIPATSGNFLETYSQLLNAGLGSVGGLVGGGNEFGIKAATPSHRNNLGSSTGRHGSYYRMARSILGYDGFKGNQLDASRSAVETHPYFYPALYRADHSLGAAQRYPPLDLPRAAAATSVTAGGSEERHLNAINADAMLQDREDADDDGAERLADLTPEEFPHIDDLPLSGYDYDDDDEMLEMQAKRLLERCSPGQRRDSYGLCRKIEGY